MTDIQDVTLYEVQKKIKPKIADIASAFFGEDSIIASIQEFCTWLRENKLSVAWKSRNAWDVKYLGKGVCHIVVIKNAVSSWYINFETGMLENAVLSEKEKRIVWKSIAYCRSCDSCRPGRKINIFNKEFDRTCLRPIVFDKPNVEDLAVAKQLIEAICGFIRSGRKIAKDPTSPNPAHWVQEQKIANVEDCIPECVDDSMKNASRDFIMHLQANNIKPKFKILCWWEANYKGLIVKIHLPYHQQKSMFSWSIGIYLNHMDMYEDTIIQEGLQHILWDNLMFCKGCPSVCAPGVDMNILGKGIKGICVHCHPTVTWIYDPDEATLIGIKRLLELEQQARSSKSLTR